MAAINPLVRNRLKTTGDIRLDDPSPLPPRLVNEDLEGIVRRPARAKPERAGQEVRFEDRLEHDPRSGLHDTITDRRDRQRPPLIAAGLRNENPTGRKRTVAAVTKVRDQLIEQPVNPVVLDVGDGDLVNTGRAAITAHQLPGALQHVPALDLVMKRVEPSPGIGFGRPVQRALQVSDLVYFGGPSHVVALTKPSPHLTHERSSGPSLTGGSVSARLDRYYGRLRLPPGTRSLPGSRRL
jgi:hypothetical protein